MMSMFIWRIFLLVSISLRLALSNQQHFVCKAIADVFVESESPSIRPHQGPPGKKGPRGFPGLRGLPGDAGPPATVDYDIINDAIDAKVENSLAKTKNKIDEITRNLSVLLSESDCNRQGGLPNAGKCFTISEQVSSSRHTNFDQAVAECARSGAFLAEIRDQPQQSAVHDFALRKMPHGLEYAEFVIGMEYNPSTSTVIYRSGTEVDTSGFHWHPTYPTSASTHIKMFLAARRTGANFGVFNWVRTYAVHGIICEKEI